MKKILLTLFIFIFIFMLSFGNTIAYYKYHTEDNNINSFINSPSLFEINRIKDKKTRVCEKVFLIAYMRREFSDLENKVCRDVFARKIEAEMNYKQKVMGERGVY